ncbi:MAG: lysophospholipid acyltransferase family protein [Acidobacteria bacterium]|nr:lysophospholipid acyltransferase family protein [Acidobacteriota bacterium]
MAPGTNKSATFRHWLEFIPLWLLVGVLRILPRFVARIVGAAIGAAAFHLLSRLRKTGLRNLEIAFPAMPPGEREGILRSLYRHLGWQLAEFCQMAGYTAERASRFIRYEGLDNYLKARDQGRGVLIITGHLGAWELSSFFHSLRGFPMAMVIRRLDNPLVDRFVNGIRCMHGNRVLHKDDSARGLLRAMHQGETVGILMDTNMTPPQGVFVPYFGTQACTGAGLARVALKTNAAVLAGFLLWNEAEKRYVLHFGPEIELTHTGDHEMDAITNTARFTLEIERYVRAYPDQWLWVHRRWKTRPEGEAKLY